MTHKLDLTDEEWKVVRILLESDHVQNAIGGEEWDLTESEEETLWSVIRKSEALGPIQ